MGVNVRKPADWYLHLRPLINGRRVRILQKDQLPLKFAKHIPATALDVRRFGFGAQRGLAIYIRSY